MTPVVPAKLVTGLSLQCEAVGCRGNLEEFGIAFKGNGRRTTLSMVS